MKYVICAEESTCWNEGITCKLRLNKGSLKNYSAITRAAITMKYIAKIKVSFEIDVVYDFDSNL